MPCFGSAITWTLRLRLLRRKYDCHHPFSSHNLAPNRHSRLHCLLWHRLWCPIIYWHPEQPQPSRFQRNRGIQCSQYITRERLHFHGGHLPNSRHLFKVGNTAAAHTTPEPSFSQTSFWKQPAKAFVPAIKPDAALNPATT